MKEKKFLRIVIVLLMLVLVMSISDTDANAATLHSQNEAVNWAVARANEKWQQDVDGVCGCQCVDLIMAYYQYLVGYHVSGNAKDYGSNSLPSGWVRVKDNPQPGDIVVWGAGAQMGWSPLETAYANSVYGHIGIIWKVNANGSVSTVETNTHLSVAAASYNRYINNCICLIRPDFNGTGYDPVGSFDSATGQTCAIRVGGWVVDQDALTSPVVVHVYVDGQFACAITANGYRPDINSTIPGSGNYHGFDKTFSAAPGTHKVEVYAINIGSQSNPLLGSKTVTVSADTEKPKVSNIRIENITEDGYVVKCTVTDNMGIKKVLFPTYPDTNGDWNAIWHEGTVSGTTATCVIKTKDHADLVNTYYQTHIYAYDYSDNTGFGATEKIYIECNHTLGAWSVIKKATCTNTGIKRATCTKCNTTVSESIAATGHSYSNWTTTQNATCTKDGVSARTCSNCGRKETKSIAAVGHSYKGWVTTKTATALTAGEMKNTCGRCGATSTKSIAKLTPTIKVTASSLKMQTNQSTSDFRVSGLQKGDYVSSVVSNKTSVVKVSNVKKTGTFKLKAQNKTGKATITITLASGLKKKVTVKVQKGTVTTTKISGLKKKITLAKGKKQTLKPVITPITSQQKVKYSSSNKSIVSVSSKGVLTAKKSGTARITVASGSKKVTITVVVPKTKTTAIKGVPSSVTIKKGKTYRLKAKRVPSNSEEKLTYKTSNKKIATVSSKGVITAKKVGTAKITVTSGKKKVTVKVVVPKTKTKTIKGVPSSLTMRKGKTYTLKAKRSPSGSDEKLTYKSSNKSIVTVSSSGKLRAKKKGTATITVTSGTVSVKCKVKVK